ncbi:A/G-specific adenine glycosylase [Sporolactobacillus putidus]|uniref:Adenine DNA glycosylase n=1 Tax=Sporolactobacillus putidus TaxID=492735 RepID=A0A917S8S6_9BACL|nr:A/G-specific adenine glycosylase [Sporolactobacillus putidus]GGL64770.1 A/G-specific adenine glycosylase [Sporolactobacillus putidus]
MNPEQIKQFNHDLLKWFHENGRDLPWRRINNPYYTWVSEVMLQQTQVDTVIPYFNRFISLFPTIEALAGATDQEVLKCWEGLGYYSRARHLQQGVREVAEKYDGKVPEDKNELLSIQGIGPYTAGALLSIAFGEPEPAVDGNVMRVMSRVFLIDDDIAKAKTKKKFEKIVGALIAEADPSAFNQSLMDLGALICRPKKPKCDECPLNAHCLAREEGAQLEYPVKSGKAKPRSIDYTVLLIRDAERRYFIEQRPETGLLAGMWQFPMIAWDPNEKEKVLEDAIQKKYGWEVRFVRTSFSYTHRFSHLIWNLSLYEAAIDGTVDPETRTTWEHLDKLTHRPFPVPHQKIIEWIEKNRQNHT